MTSDTKTIKILHLRSSGGLYGAEQVILNLAKAGQNLHTQHAVVCLNNSKNPHTELVDEASKLGIDASSVNCQGTYDKTCILAIRKKVREEGFNIIHSHDYKANFYAYFAAYKLPVKKIATVHGYLSNSLKLKAYEIFDKLLLNEFDAVIAVSQKIADELRPFLRPSRKKRLSVIANGLDLSRFPLSEKKHISSDKKFIISNIARLSLEKGQAWLLYALKILIKKDGLKNIQLQLIGGGPERANLIKLCEELDLSFCECPAGSPPQEPDVVFCGIRSDIADILSGTGLFILPSRREGLPMSILEAMATGVPVLATTVGDIQKVIKDNETGFLLQSRNPVVIADKMNTVISQILRNDPMIADIIQAARKWVEDHYSATAMAKQYTEIYTQL